jgi:uncharacterized protein
VKWAWSKVQPVVANPISGVSQRREPMLVTPEAVAIAGRGIREPQFLSARDVYRVAAPTPGVVPQRIAADAQRANDDVSGLYNSMQGLGYTTGVGWLGMPYLSELAQRSEYRRPADIMAKSMTRKWIKIKTSSEDDKTDKIKKLEAAVTKFRVQHIICKAIEHDGYFGRSHVFIDTGADDDAELQMPLLLHKAKVKKGGLKGFRVVEPIWTYPATYDTVNPLSPDFYRPSAWYVMAKTIHRSRLLTFVARQVPDLLKPAYQFGGLSLSQLAKPYVDFWLRDRRSVSNMLNTYSSMVLTTPALANVLNAGAAQNLMNRLNLYNVTRDNQGILAVQAGPDGEGETLENIAAPLSGLDALQAQSQEHMASVNGIPIVVLFGITPSGLNASAEPEIKVFYEFIHSQQEHFIRPHLTTMLQYIQLSEFGEIDEDITFDFEPLWMLDDAGLAAVQKTKADIHAVYLQEGVVDASEVRLSVASDEDSYYHGLDLSTPPPEPPEQTGVNASDPDSDKIGREAENDSESGANSGV